MGNESHNNTSGYWGLGTGDGRMKGMDKYIQKIPGGIRIQELQKIPAPWNVPHLKKGTSHQVDFNLVQTPGPRLGPVVQLRSERSEGAAT